MAAAKKQTKRKTIDRLVYYPTNTFNKLNIYCTQNEIPMSKLVLSLVENFIFKQDKKQANGK